MAIKNLAELRRKQHSFKDRMEAIVSKAADSDEGMTDEDVKMFDEAEKCFKDIGERIERLEALNEEKANDSEPVDEPDENEELCYTAPVRKSNVVIKRKAEVEAAPGCKVVRFMFGEVIAQKAHSFNAGARFIEQMFGDYEVAKALNSTTAQTGGALVPQDFVAELIPLLYAQSTVRNLRGVRTYPMVNGNLTLPRLYGGATASYIGELDQIPPSQGTTDDIQMSAKKLVALVPATMDLIRRSAISAEQMIRDDMVQQLALKEDISFLTGAGTGGVPKGLANWAGTSLTPSGATLGNVLAALRNAELSLIGANVPMRNASWIWHPSVRMFLDTLTDSVGRPFFADELDKGYLNGYPYAESTQLPTNLSGGTNQTQIFLVAGDEVIIADSLNMAVESSVVASYNASGTQVNSFQEDKIVFRAICEHDLAVRHPAAVCVSQVTSWFPSGFTTSAGAPYSTQSEDTDTSGAESTQG